MLQNIFLEALASTGGPKKRCRVLGLAGGRRDGGSSGTLCVCVFYYCRTYYKAVRVAWGDTCLRVIACFLRFGCVVMCAGKIQGLQQA